SLIASPPINDAVKTNRSDPHIAIGTRSLRLFLGRINLPREVAASSASELLPVRTFLRGNGQIALRARCSRAGTPRGCPVAGNDFRLRQRPDAAVDRRAIEPEGTDPIVHVTRLLLQRLGGGGVLLHQGGVLLRYLVHLRERGVDLVDAGRLLAAGRG